MALQLIAYDLHNGTKAVYDELISAIELVAEDSIEIEKSVWVISDDRTCQELHDYFEEYLSETDKLFIAPFPEATWSEGITGLHKFIEDHS